MLLAITNQNVKLRLITDGTGTYLLGTPGLTPFWDLLSIRHRLSRSGFNSASTNIIFNFRMIIKAKMNQKNWKKIFCFKLLGSRLFRSNPYENPIDQSVRVPLFRPETRTQLSDDANLSSLASPPPLPRFITHSSSPRIRPLCLSPTFPPLPLLPKANVCLLGHSRPPHSRRD